MITLSAPCRALMDAEPLTVRPDDLLSRRRRGGQGRPLPRGGRRRRRAAARSGSSPAPTSSTPSRAACCSSTTPSRRRACPASSRPRSSRSSTTTTSARSRRTVPVRATFDPVGSTATLVDRALPPERDGAEPPDGDAAARRGPVGHGDPQLADDDRARPRASSSTSSACSRSTPTDVRARDVRGDLRRLRASPPTTIVAPRRQGVRRSASGQTICIAQIETVGQALARPPRRAAGGAASACARRTDYRSVRADGHRHPRQGHRAARRGRPGAARARVRAARSSDGAIDLPGRHEPQEAGRAEAPGRAVSTGPQPSASYSVTMRVQLPHTAGSFAEGGRRDRRRRRDPRRDRPRARRGRRASCAT